MNRKEIEKRMTQLVTAQLENGQAPWRKPWVGAAGYVPTSLQTGKPYRGINRFVLSLFGAEYERPLWVTYLGAKHLGSHVRRGQSGVPVVYYSMINKRDKETGEEYRVPLMRLSTVFNVAQCCDGCDTCEGITIPAKWFRPRPAVPVLDGVQALLDKYTDKPRITNAGGDEAFYSPMMDSITIPLREQFNRAEDYAYTLAHELTHSTSHEKRLNRKAESGFAPFGSPSYAREELVADLGAQMVLADLGVQADMDNSAAYVAGWLKALNDDPSMLIKACSDAQKAADYMLGIKAEDTETAEEQEELVAV